MNARIKKLTLEALRGGEYTQATGALRNPDGFCCLGVICDLHRKETDNSWDNLDYCGEYEILPQRVADWAGFSSRNPLVVSKGGHRALSDLNDAGYTFEQIADLIEANL